MSKHPDAAYLKQDEIGLVLAKGMAATFKAQPKNPIDFFARWLLSEAEVGKRQQVATEHQTAVLDLKDKHAEEEKERDATAALALAEQTKKEKAHEDFRAQVRASTDLSDQLQPLVDHLQGVTSSTAVYVGKVVLPIKAIQEGDGEDAHVDADAVPQIQFLHSSSEHQFMVDKILKQEQGITYSLFLPEEAKPEDEAVEEEVPEGEEPKPKVKKEVLPRHLSVDQVVSNPSIHFYKVPRLGSYLAVKLEFESCLFEEAFDAAVLDFVEVGTKRSEQERERKEYEETLAESKAEKEEAGEEFEQPEEKVWEVIEHAPFQTKQVQYVVCLNTMGQDRAFTEDEKLAALRSVQEYRDRWEALEKENLAADVQAKLERADQNGAYKEHHEPMDLAELDRLVEDAVGSAIPEDGAEMLTEEDKTLIGLKAKFQNLTKSFHAPDLAAAHKTKMERLAKEQLKSGGGDRASAGVASSKGDDASAQQAYTAMVPEQWQEKFKELRGVFVLKYARIIQALFYLLRYQEREDVCDKGTNRMLWKNAKLFINDELFVRMSDYWPPGPKEDDYREYEKLMFVQSSISSYSEEAVEDYSTALGKILKWIKVAIQVRVEDVRQRRAAKEALDNERKEALEKEKERMEKRTAAHDEAKAVFDEKTDADWAEKKAAAEAAKAEDEDAEELDEDDKPEFDADDWFANFDDENPAGEVPEEVEDDMDNDFNIPIESPEDEEDA